MGKVKHPVKAKLADPKYDRESVEHAIKWCKRTNSTFNGFYFDDELAGPEGVYLSLFVPQGTEYKDIEKALDQAYHQRDIVNHRTLVCPSEWLL